MPKGVDIKVNFATDFFKNKRERERERIVRYLPIAYHKIVHNWNWDQLALDLKRNEKEKDEEQTISSSCWHLFAFVDCFLRKKSNRHFAQKKKHISFNWEKRQKLIKK